ncbi:MAG: FtsX-like permease family protein [Rikenellaceae bacterium]
MFKNFYHTLRSFKLSSSLNIIGLTIAFTAFIVIMMQVNFDKGFDAFHKKADRIYRIEFSRDSVNYTHTISRPLGEEMANCSPIIQNYGTISKKVMPYKVVGSNTEEILGIFNDISPDMVKIFDFEFVEGNGDCLKNPNEVIIPISIAQKISSEKSALGKEILIVDGGNKVFKIGGVYKDIPKNSFLENNIYFNIGDRYIGDQSEWSFPYYMVLGDARQKAGVEKMMNKLANKDNNDKSSEVSMRLHLVKDIHFAKDISFDGTPKGDKMTTNILFGIAILIIVIASINFLNLAMATTPLRLKSINIHKILGSSVAKLRMWMISEAIFMAIISYSIALLAIYYISNSPFADLISADMHIKNNIGIVIITAIVAIVAGVVAGILPALYSTSFAPMIVIKGSFGNTPKGKLFRTILIAFQYVISLSLIVCAMLMVTQNIFMKNHPVGFNRDNILCAQLSTNVIDKKDAFVQKLKSNPAVIDVTFSQGPIVANSKMGWGRSYKGKQVDFNCFPVAWNYLRFMKMEIVEGRDFNEEDEIKEKGTIIFNEKAVKKYGFVVGENAPGHNGSSDMVGVVKNFNFEPMHYGIDPIALYIFGNNPWWPLQYLNVRVSGDKTRETITYIEKTIREFDPKSNNVKVEFMDETIGRLYEKEDQLAELILIFGVIAMLISLVGILGLILYETQYRRKEIGLRKINGATSSSVLFMFNKKFIYLVGICFLIASPISYYAINRWLDNFTYRTQIYWWIFALALLIVLTITVLVITIQSWRAATENPINSIKNE